MTALLYSAPLSSPQEHLWKLRFLHKLEDRIVPRKHSRWGHLLCTWHEINPDKSISTHHYAASIDTIKWGVYLDCRPRKIFAKILVQFFTRPFHCVLKTIYHLSMMPIFQEISETFQKRQTAAGCLKNSLKSIADIVRTPLYGIAIMIISIAVLVLGILNPQTLYTGRAFLGEIECAANWGMRHTAWTLAGCFQPYPMTILEVYNHQKCSIDTVYDSKDPLDIQLSDYARRNIVHKRRKFDFFACGTLNPQKTYISPVLRTKAAKTALPKQVQKSDF